MLEVMGANGDRACHHTDDGRATVATSKPGDPEFAARTQEGVDDITPRGQCSLNGQYLRPTSALLRRSVGRSRRQIAGDAKRAETSGETRVSAVAVPTTADVIDGTRSLFNARQDRQQAS